MNRLRLRKDEGFSLVELLVTVVIIAVLAAIAIPLYTSQKNKANLAAAQDDARAIGMELASTVSDYTSFGAANGSMAGSGTAPALTITITMGTGTLPVPVGLTKATAAMRMSPGSAFTSGNVSIAAGLANYCFIITNNSQVAVFDNAGVKSGGTTCTNGVAS